MLKNIFTKRNLKVVGLIILVLIVSSVLTIVALSEYYKYSQKKAQMEFIEELQRPYFEDTYGGKTPEETFDMFLDALKKGDVELASKYFIIEKQEKRKKYLEKVADIGRLEEMVNDLNNGLEYTGSLYENDERYEIKDSKEKIIFGSVNFTKYPSGVWKLKEL